MEITSLDNLLHNIATTTSKFKEISRISGDRFNIFSILKVESKEVKLHSMFISELLDPNGTHDKGTMFLDLFMHDLRLFVPELQFVISSKVNVTVEKHIGTKTENEGGRLDILLTDESGNIVVIENKIYAGDQENQLLRYHNFRSRQKCLLYLTLHGKAPVDFNGLIKDRDFYCISYSSFIVSWIEKCYSAAISQAKLRETLVQYLSIIKRLSGESTANMDEKKEIYRNIGNTEQSATAALALVEVWKDVKWFTEEDFWKELSFEFKNVDRYPVKETFNEERLNNAIHEKRRRNPFYGLELDLGKISDYNVIFSIRRGFGHLCYGLYFVHVTANPVHYTDAKITFDDNLPVKFSHFVKAKHDDCWSYESEAVVKINFESFEDEDTIKLINPAFRKQAIKKFLDECIDIINAFETANFIIAENTDGILTMSKSS